MTSQRVSQVGHLPWFSTYNVLTARWPAPRRDALLLQLLRNAVIGFICTLVSDTISVRGRLLCSSSLDVLCGEELHQGGQGSAANVGAPHHVCRSCQAGGKTNRISAIELTAWARCSWRRTGCGGCLAVGSRRVCSPTGSKGQRWLLLSCSRLLNPFAASCSLCCGGTSTTRFSGANEASGARRACWMSSSHSADEMSSEVAPLLAVNADPKAPAQASSGAGPLHSHTAWCTHSTADTMSNVVIFRFRLRSRPFLLVTRPPSCVAAMGLDYSIIMPSMWLYLRSLEADVPEYMLGCAGSSFLVGGPDALRRFAMGAFALCSMLMQTPVGLWLDRRPMREVLVGTLWVCFLGNFGAVRQLLSRSCLTRWRLAGYFLAPNVWCVVASRFIAGTMQSPQDCALTIRTRDGRCEWRLLLAFATPR